MRESAKSSLIIIVRQLGMPGLKNGELLKAAETAGFEVFLTVDQGVEYQQNLAGRKIAIVIFRGKID